jgi:hypothetical protein
MPLRAKSCRNQRLGREREHVAIYCALPRTIPGRFRENRQGTDRAGEGDANYHKAQHQRAERPGTPSGSDGLTPLQRFHCVLGRSNPRAIRHGFRRCSYRGTMSGWISVDHISAFGYCSDHLFTGCGKECNGSVMCLTNACG